MANEPTPSTPPAPGAPEPATPPATPPGDPAPQPEPTPDDPKSKGSKEAVLADLAKERDARQALQKQVADMQEAQKKRDEALALALGVKEAPKSEEDVSEKLKELQESIAKDRLDALREGLIVKHSIDEDHQDLLTETDPEKLKAQAAKVGALIAAKDAPSDPQNPAFQPNPGQGRGGNPAEDAAKEAEYRTYFPDPKPK